MKKKLWWYQACILVRLHNKSQKVDYINGYAGNDDITILDLLIGILCVGQDDNTGVQVGLNFPISSTAR